MIAGAVSADREAIVVIDILDETGIRHAISALIDTGFDGFLTLPDEALKECSALCIGHAEIILADGSATTCSVYELPIDWDGEIRVIEVDASNSIPLVGMALLEGFVLHVDVVTGGLVTITRHDDSVDPLG